MEELNKTQLILLALLLSFVTSLATGIVTVTLMDQAPESVTQTINRVVERTVQVAVPLKSQPATVTETVVVKEEDFIIDATERNRGNVIEVGIPKKGLLGINTKVESDDDVEFKGTGFVISKKGLFVASAELFEEDSLIVRSAEDKTLLEAKVLERSDAYSLVLAQIGNELLKTSSGTSTSSTSTSERIAFTDVELGSEQSLTLGQTAIVLGARNGLQLLLGVISQVRDFGEEKENPAHAKEVHITASLNELYSGGPLINLEGKVVGVVVLEHGAPRIFSSSVLKNLSTSQDVSGESETTKPPIEGSS